MNLPGHLEVEAFRRLVTTRLGLLSDEGKLEMLAQTLARRAAARGFAPDDYLGRLDSGSIPGEIGALAQELTVTETYFFRNSAHFRVLRDIVLPDRMAIRAPARLLRFLSAGCASGDEAFTIAMVIRDVIAEPGWDIAIEAVDANPAMLRKAREGHYSPWSLRETPADMQRRWFRKHGRDMVLDGSIIDAVNFREVNLVTDSPESLPPDGYDAIFCRNMLMYFTTETARALVARLAKWLAPGGYLFLGHAETLGGFSRDFHLRHTHDSFYYQLKDGPARSVYVPGPAARPFRQEERSLSSAQAWTSAIGRSAERIEVLATLTRPAEVSPKGAAPMAPMDGALDLLARERFADALRLLEQLPPEQGADPDVLLLKATLLSHSGRVAEAERVSQRLLHQEEFNAGGHHVLALCREARGDIEGAADHYQLAAYLDPAFAMPRLRVGLLFRRLGQYQAANQALAAALPLLEREKSSRLLFFGGGFSRDALLGLCREELKALERE